MGNKLTPELKGQIKTAFDHFDADKSGEITVDELQVYKSSPLLSSSAIYIPLLTIYMYIHTKERKEIDLISYSSLSILITVMIFMFIIYLSFRKR